MVAEAKFTVAVTDETPRAFATLSGDWNPLHTDPAHAARTSYRRPVLHGAFSAGLVSRMAGMHLPGTDCLLHGMRLRFVAPIVPPARLVVSGRVVADGGDAGSVAVTITDEDNGRLYTEASYEFGRHSHDLAPEQPAAASSSLAAPDRAIPPEGLVLVTGASGGLGGALMAQLGDRALALGRESDGHYRIPDHVGEDSVAALVHCGWPAPDNVGLTRLDAAEAAIRHHVAEPLERIIEAARLVRRFGRKGAMLVLVGSTFAKPGRHNWRMPLYSLAKTMVPTITEILALELAAQGQRCVAVTFDMLDGGMNAGSTPRIRQMHADRSPWQRLAKPEEAAVQIAWVLDNPHPFVSGAAITLSGGALP